MLASYLDSTNLKAEATAKDISTLCEQAARYKMAAVCINPYYVKIARNILEGSGVAVCTVCGFPLGAGCSEVKAYEARLALEHGAQEIDMLINLGNVKQANYSRVREEINLLMKLKQEFPFILKIIVETALLAEHELLALVKILGEAGVDYVKTSTGFSSRGVNLTDIYIIKREKRPDLKIKASGGVKTLDFALQLIDAGVHRIGSSSAAVLLEEYIRGGHKLKG